MSTFLKMDLNRSILSIVLFCAIGYHLNAQTPLKLIPTPRQTQIGSGSFTIDAGLILIANESTSSETKFSLQQLSDEIKTDLGFVPATSKKASGNSVQLILLNSGNSKISAIEKEALSSLPEAQKEEGYLLKVESGKIYILAYSETGLFYGVQTLKQLIRANRTGNSIPCLTITDWPSLRYRGWMDDISRGPIPTVDFVKKCILKMAEYKQNYFTLYTEHTFRLDRYPDIAPPGTFTAAEIKDLTDFAAKYHMDVVGNFQSFGHMEKILGNPFFANFRESGNILNPTDEATYQFLSDIYSEIVPAYKSPFFNINCDETQGLGEGKSKAMADSIGTGGIYAYHINRINELLKPYGKRVMMWGDIAVNNPEIIARLPKDLIILSWGYGAEESFDNAILPFQKTGFDFMIAPGVGCWGEIWPAITNAAVNINNYVRDGAKLGAMGMMNTAWDDNGHNLFNYNWHGLVWGAECSWSPASPLSGDAANAERNQNLKKFNAYFDALFFEKAGVTKQLIQIDSLRFRNMKGLLGEGSFWQDITEFYPENTSDAVIKNAVEIQRECKEISWNLEQLCPANGNEKAMVDGAQLALQRVIFNTRKNSARVLLYKAYQSADAKDITKARLALSELVTQLYSIKKEYIRLWNLENRSWWLDKNLNDYNKLAQQIEDADKKVFIEPLPEVTDGKRSVKLRTVFNDKKIIYTLDGSEPSLTSEVYSAPLIIEGHAIIKACVLENNAIGKVSEKAILMHKGIGHFRKLNSKYSPYNPAYAAGGEQGLVDGQRGSGSFSDGKWQGFQGTDLDIELDFGKIIDVNSVSCNFLQSSYSWILLPKEVKMLTSMDGINYTLQQTIKQDIPQQDQKLIIHTFMSSGKPFKTQYLKFIAVNPGPLPAWHHASGSPSFIFADEIIID